MSAIDLVILDCDGVLIDSERLAVQVDLQLLAELGWRMDEAEAIERFVGRSDVAIQAEVEAYLGRALPADWAQLFERLSRPVFEAELEAVDGVRDALDRIALPTCVASSSRHRKLRFTLGLVGLYERFDGRVFSAEDVSNGKPAPDLFLHAAREMGAHPSRCVVVEDSRYGVQAARAAGMRVLGFAGGLTPGHVLEGPNTIVFESMHELPGLIDACDRVAFETA
jgi:HAD superfamily hydrolase (TIGR01509 family)